MNLIENFKKNKSKGYVYAFRKAIQELIGMKDYDEMIDTMYFFLNHMTDIKQFPEAVGPLRDLQECDILLIAIFDKVCQKHGLTYWMDYGTLLGGVRHGGFIPWDDDVDLAMPREDYEKALKILPQELESFGIIAKEAKSELMGRIGIGYRHSETGIWIDVFPVDTYYAEKWDEKTVDATIASIRSYQNFYFKNRMTMDADAMESYKKSKVINYGAPIDGMDRVFIHSPEFRSAEFSVHPYDKVLPLKKMKFDDFYFFAPKDAHRYISQYYGEGYMGYPKNGIEHHGDNRGALSNWANNAGIDMNDVKAVLRTILEQI